MSLLTQIAIQLAGGALAGIFVAFYAINLGLRLRPEGRAFLADARAQGRIFANPGPDDPPAIRAVFAMATVWAILAAVAVFFTLGALLWLAQPVPLYSGYELA